MIDVLNNKQDKLIAGDGITIAGDGKTISASDWTIYTGDLINLFEKTSNQLKIKQPILIQAIYQNNRAFYIGSTYLNPFKMLIDNNAFTISVKAYADSAKIVSFNFNYYSNSINLSAMDQSGDHYERKLNNDFNSITRKGFYIIYTRS